MKKALTKAKDSTSSIQPVSAIKFINNILPIIGILLAATIALSGCENQKKDSNADQANSTNQTRSTKHREDVILITNLPNNLKLYQNFDTGISFEFPTDLIHSNGNFYTKADWECLENEASNTQKNVNCSGISSPQFRIITTPEIRNIEYIKSTVNKNYDFEKYIKPNITTKYFGENQFAVFNQNAVDQSGCSYSTDEYKNARPHNYSFHTFHNCKENFLDEVLKSIKFINAVELKEYNKILFSEKTEDKNFLKMINTKAPFIIEKAVELPENVGAPFMSTEKNYVYYVKEKDVYIFNGHYGELCGAAYYVFAFSPITKDFLSGGSNSNCGYKAITFVSSKGNFSAKSFQLVSEIDKENIEEQKIYKNPHTLDELCGPIYMSTEDIQGQKNFAEGFPNKVYCYKNYWSASDRKNDTPVGYFDLTKDRFVYLK